MILKDISQSPPLAQPLLYRKDIDVPSKQLLGGIPHEELFFALAPIGGPWSTLG
jgi:hypothetical protein